MAATLDNLRLEEGQSEALRAAFACILEAAAADGRPRYAPGTGRALVRAVVCRNYARPILELVHLIIAASRVSEGRFEDVFWGPTAARPAAFRGQFADTENPPAGLGVHDDRIVVGTGDGAFAVSYGRMPFLTALLEFLITVLGYAEVDRMTAALRGPDADAAAAAAAARDLQKALYEYLKTHLPTAQRQRRERHFLAFVDTRAGNRAGADAIDDGAVLDYWCTHAADDAIEAKTFRVVYETAGRLIRALDAAIERTAAARARPIGTDVEAGEIDPADIDAVAAALDDHDGPLSRLLSASGDLAKFVNGGEAELLATLPLGAARSGEARRLPVSVLRNAEYGARQARISAALRRDEDAGAAMRPPLGAYYRDRLGAFVALAEGLERLILAALAILHRNGHRGAIAVALGVAPDLDWGVLAAEPAGAANVVPLAARDAAGRFFATRPDAAGDEVAALLADARQALRGINRIGFKGQPDPATLDVLADAAPPAIELAQALRRFVRHDAGGQDWPTIEASDARTFPEMFQAIYAPENGHGGRHAG